MIIDLEEPATIDTTNEAADQAAELLEGDETFTPASPDGPPDETNQASNETNQANPETFAPGIQEANTPESDVKEPQQQPETDICGAPLPLTDQQIAKQKAEADFRERIDRLSKNVAEVAVQWTDAKERAKSAKKQFDHAIEMLTEAADKGPCYMPLFDRQPEVSRETESSTEPEQTPEPQPDPDAWRLPSINEIGLKPKLAETLLEAGIETIGMLEDLRADISQGRKKWPKGIGNAKVTQIEDAVINWLSKNRDRSTIAEATDEGEAAHDALMARVEQLGEGDLKSQHAEGNKYWQSGFEASQRSLELRECPYVPGAEQDDWIRGWFANENIVPVTPPVTTETTTETTAETTIDLDDL